MVDGLSKNKGNDMRSKTESTTGQTIKPEPKNLQVNPEEFAKKLLEFIPANINKIIDEAEKEYLAKGKIKPAKIALKI